MIKEALLDLLKTKPLAKITVSELCNHSSVNRTTFYRHYESLQDVLKEFEFDFIKQIPKPNFFPNNDLDMQKHIATTCTYIYEHADIVKIFFLNLSDSDFLEVMYKFYKEFLEAFPERDIPFSHLDDDTIQMIIAFFCGGWLSLIRKWILDDVNKTPTEIANILYNAFPFPNYPIKFDK